MEKTTKIAMFEGGPLDGDSIEIEADLTTYKSLKMVPHPFPSDTEAPLENREFTYVEQPVGSGHFVCMN